MSFSLPTSEWFGVSSPVVVLFLGGVLILLLGMPAFVARRRSIPALLGMVVIGGSFGIIFLLKPYIYTQQLPMEAMYVYDSYARYFQVLFLAVAFLGCAAVGLSREGESRLAAANVALLLILSAALTLLATSADLFVLYLSGELAVLVYYIFSSSGETGRAFARAVRFIRNGAVASLFMLLGLVLLFGMAGSTSLWEIAGKMQFVFFGEAVSASPVEKALLLVSLGLFFSGFLLRIESFPFQEWMADAFQNMRSSPAAFLSTGIKAASFAAVMRILWILVIRHSRDFYRNFPLIVVISVLAILTLAVGSMKALRERDFGRFMAYSGAAHTGLMLLGLASLDREGIEAVILYITLYAFMTGGLFLVYSVAGRQAGRGGLDAFDGLHGRSPFSAAAAALFLLSLIGLPPTGGFAAKYVLIRSLLNNAALWYKFLAVAGLIGCAVSLVIYGRVLYAVYFKPAPEAVRGRKMEGAEPWGYRATAVFLVVVLIAAGVYWKPLQEAVVCAMMIIEYQY